LLAEENAHLAPRFVVVQPIERVAGADARLAPGATVKVDFKGVLLSRSGRGGGEKVAIIFSLKVAPGGLVFLAETFDGSEPLLIAKIEVNEAGDFGFCVAYQHVCLRSGAESGSGERV
jgi:hypothetical protein